MKIKRIEAINLNALLADLIISGDEILQNTRINIIKTKLQLSQFAKLFEKHRDATIKECDGNETIFKNIIEEYLLESIDLKVYPILEEQFDSLLKINTIKTGSAELLYKLLVNLEENGDTIVCNN